MRQRPRPLLDHHRLGRVVEQRGGGDEARDRGAELVGDVGGEAALPFRGLVELVDRAPERLGHVVQGPAECRDLVTAARVQAGIEIAGGQPPRERS